MVSAEQSLPILEGAGWAVDNCFWLIALFFVSVLFDFAFRILSKVWVYMRRKCVAHAPRSNAISSSFEDVPLSEVDNELAGGGLLDIIVGRENVTM